MLKLPLLKLTLLIINTSNDLSNRAELVICLILFR